MRNARRIDTATARCPITEGSGPGYLPLQGAGGVRPCLSVHASCSRALSSPSAAGSQNSPLTVTRMRRVLTLSTHLLSERRLTQAKSGDSEESPRFENGNVWYGLKSSRTQKSGEPSYGIGHRAVAVSIRLAFLILMKHLLCSLDSPPWSVALTVATFLCCC